MRLSLNVIFEDNSEGNLYRTVEVDSSGPWKAELAKEYVRLRSSTVGDLSSISLDGITILSPQKLRARLKQATVPNRRGSPLDVVRSDFGETLAYLLLEQEFGTAIGYKGVRDRETINLPGRGIDIIGIETNPHFCLVLGEVKVSEENRTPPSVVDRNNDSLSKQLKFHVREHSITSQKLWDTARKVLDDAIRNNLFRAALAWDEKRWDLLRVLCCAILVRPKNIYKVKDFGSLKRYPRSMRPGTTRFIIVCIPDGIEATVSAWFEFVQRKEEDE